MSQLQQDFESFFKWDYQGDVDFSNGINYSSVEAEIGFKYWEAAYFTYSQDNQKYIDLLKDIYYNSDTSSWVEESIEKLLGGLL